MLPIQIHVYGNSENLSTGFLHLGITKQTICGNFKNDRSAFYSF